MKILKALHNISSDSNSSTDDKLRRLLSLGLEALTMDVGIIARIEGGTYHVVSAVSFDSGLCAGDMFNVEDTYCSETLKADGIRAFPNTADAPGVNHPCYEKFKLKSYIGIPLVVNGKRYGTVNFSSPLKRETRFNEEERQYVMLLAEWVGTEISRQQYLNDLFTQQEALRHQHKMLVQMSELARVGTWEVDLIKEEVTWSDSLRKLYEVPDDFALNFESSMQFVLHEEDNMRVRELFENCKANGEGWSLEMEMVTYTGKHFWIQTLGKAEKENGNVVRFYGATQDVTERVMAARELEKRSQIAEQALESRSRFLATVSHEIRTPINGVLGMLEALRSTALTERQSEFTALATQSAQNLLQLINDVLDFSKIDAGEMVFEQIPLSVSQIAEEQHRVFQHAAAKRELTFALDTTRTDGLMFIGDPTRIRQIFTNLLNNAIKFTPQGRIDLITRAMQQTSGEYLVQVVVKDTGIGIPASHQASIFSPFRQGDSATTRQYGGTGLGLSIVSQIAEQMHGGVRVNSREGEGTTFIVAFQLPLAEQAEGSGSVLPSPQPSEPVLKGQFKGKRILAVEDNDINQVVINEQLSELGATVDAADNGSQAVEMVVRSLATHTHYDLILMDCQMPVMDGYQAASAIRELGGRALLIPIVALTANVMAGEQEKCVLAGMNDYLAKPVSLPKLAKCLRHYLLVQHDE